MQKYILITGASSGIGKSTAELLAKNGYSVLATVRKEEDKQNIEKINSNIKCFICDLTKENDIINLKSEIEKETQNIYALINNAGMAYSNILESVNIEELKEQFEINTFAPLRLTKEILPLIDEGKIINISSISSNIVYPFISPYCASKKAMDIFFQALAIEINNPKIKIISIKPATIKTPIWEKSHTAANERFKKLPTNIQNKYHVILKKLLTASTKSANKGIEVEKVSNLILKVLKCKNPKMSYCIGITSHIAVWFNKLPIELQTKIAKTVLKTKLNNN